MNFLEIPITMEAHARYHVCPECEQGFKMYSIISRLRCPNCGREMFSYSTQEAAERDTAKHRHLFHNTTTASTKEPV